MRPGQVSDQTHNHAVMLQQPLQAGVPCSGKVAVRQMSSRLGQTLLEAGSRSLPDTENLIKEFTTLKSALSTVPDFAILGTSS